MHYNSALLKVKYNILTIMLHVGAIMTWFLKGEIVPSLGLKTISFLLQTIKQQQKSYLKNSASYKTQLGDCYT